MKSFLIYLFIGISFLTNAQNLDGFIPNDAAFVITLNPQYLNDKVNLKELQQYEFYDMALMQLGMVTGASNGIGSALLAEESSTGINLMQPSYFFGQVNDDKFNFGVILQLSDSQKFKNFLFTEGNWQSTEISNWENYQMAVPEKDMAVAWNDKMVFIGGSEMMDDEPKIYDDEEFDWEEEIEEETEFEDQSIEDTDHQEKITIEPEPVNDEKNMLIRAASINYVKESLNRTHANSIASNIQYDNAKKHYDDVHFYLNYGWVMKWAQKQQGNNPFAGGTDEFMQYFEALMGSMYENTFLSMGLNFNSGNIAFDTRMYSDGGYMNLSRKMFDSKYNKKFSKYIKGGELLGFWNFNMSTEGMIEGYKSMAYDMAESVPGYGSLGKSAIELIGIVIDEEAIANVFTGNAVIAVTGMEAVSKTITTYEYDEEFNSTEVTKEVSEEVPIFTMMAEYGNEKDVMKFIRLGINSSFVSVEKDYFKMSVPEIGDFYMALRRGIFFLSNDKDLIANHLDSGYPKRERVTIDQCRMMAKNAQALYWDIPNTMTALNAEEAASMMGAGDFVNMGKQTFDSFTIITSKKMDTSLNTSFKFNLANKNENSLKVVFDLINDVVSGMMGGKT